MIAAAQDSLESVRIASGKSADSVGVEAFLGLPALVSAISSAGTGLKIGVSALCLKGKCGCYGRTYDRCYICGTWSWMRWWTENGDDKK